MQLFTRALLTPDLSFKTLADARAATGADGLPRLMRTTRFAEAEITWRGRQWLLSMPLSPAALASVERTASQSCGRLNTDHLDGIPHPAGGNALDRRGWATSGVTGPRRCSTFPAGQTVRRGAATRSPTERFCSRRSTPCETALRELELLAQQPPGRKPALVRAGGSCRCATTTPAFRPFGRRRGRCESLREPGPPDGRGADVPAVGERRRGRLHPGTAA